MKSGLTFPLVILSKLSITFDYNNKEKATLVCTQQCLTITFMLSNNLHYIDNICKVVHLIMVLIGMNCCWKRLAGQVNPAWLATIVTNFMFGSSFTNCLPHLKGEEVFGYAKRPTNSCPPSIDNDSHHFNHVNFFCPLITILNLVPNNVKDVHMQQPPLSPCNLLLLVYQSGLELKETICVDSQWHIECCPPNFAIQCYTFQKTTGLKCKTRINLYEYVSGTLVPCYSSLWVEYHNGSLQHHKH
jgi:hypothetical protein